MSRKPGLSRVMFAVLVASLATDAAAQRHVRHSPTPPETPQRALPEALWAREVTSPFGVAVSSSAEASRAGTQILEAGGNAIDAAVAMAFALGVAEPGASGLGGQTYILLRLADGRTTTIEGLSTAPRRTSRHELQTLDEADTFWGYKTATTPGTLAALAYTLERYGTMTLEQVLAPAIEIAELGYQLSPTSLAFVESYHRKVRASDYLCSLLLKDCFEPFEAGHRYCHPELACFMRRLAREGAASFYRGAIADEIDADMRRHGGYIRKADLALVKAIEREPVRGRYRGFEILSFPPPGGGGAVIEALNILDTFPQEMLRADSTDRLQLLVEAVRLAQYDTNPSREQWNSQQQIAEDRSLAARRAALIHLGRALWDRELGSPQHGPWEEKDTTQAAAADAAGNVVDLIQSLGANFGGGAVTPGLGFPYNSLLASFELQDTTSPLYLAPMKEPYTPAAPTIVLHNGKPFLALGTPGSGRITSVTVSVIVNAIDRGMPPCEAVTAPRVLWSGSDHKVYMEIADDLTEEQAYALEARGFSGLYRLSFPPRPIDGSAFGGGNSVFIDPADGTLVGVGDPRRQGQAAGAAAGARARLFDGPLAFCGPPQVPGRAEVGPQARRPRR